MLEDEREDLWQEYIEWLTSIGSTYDDVHLTIDGKTVVFMTDTQLAKLPEDLQLERVGGVRVDLETGERWLSVLVPDKYQEL